MSTIIDFHAHIYPDKIAEKAAHSIGQFYSIPMVHNGSVAALLESGQRGGVDRFVVQSVATTAAQVESINDFIAKQVQANGGRLIGLGTLHPEKENLGAEIERCAELGLKGIKLHPDFQKFNIDDKRMMPVYDYLQARRLPILLHCGDYRTDFSHPSRLARILDNFPKLVVVGAHFGGWSVWDLAKEYLEHRSCFLDTSSSLAFLGSVRSKELIRAYGAERMIFGVDFPMWDHKEELERFYALGLSDEENRMILHDNALRVLHMAEL